MTWPAGQRWTVDECQDASGHRTIRLSDGTENGNIEEQPIATVYNDRDAHAIAAVPQLVEALEAAIPLLNMLDDFARHTAIYSAETALRAAKGKS